jgi:hypothetical protein
MQKQIWNVAAYALMVADPYIEKTELEVGHVGQSASVIAFLIYKLVQNRASRDKLTLFGDG